MTSRRGQYYRCRSSVHEVLNLGLNTLEGAIMKIFHAAFAALLITGSMFVQPAHAQSTPQKYRTSCTDARVEAALSAVLPTDGKGHPSRMSIGVSAI
jgi:hypothetical protein